jgi:hypothetical protein
MSSWLENYEGVWERFNKFKAEFPDYRHKSHVLAESLTKDSSVYIVKTELWRTWNDPEPFATGLSSEDKGKPYAIEMAESGSLGRALQVAGYAAKPNGAPKKPIQTTSPKLAEFVQEQRPNDPEPIVWDVSAVAEQLGAEVIDDVPICSHGVMIYKEGHNDRGDYRGFVCPSKEKSCNKWYKLDSAGKWYLPK